MSLLGSFSLLRRDQALMDVLRSAAALLCPDLTDVIRHDSAVTASTWRAKVETGKAIELASLCGVVASLRRASWEVSFPDVYREKPDLFYLRNVVPTHHGAQAGHDTAMFGALSLEDRFLASMTPKASARSSKGKELLIFREGHPVHFINWQASGNSEYLDRPDILLAEGQLCTKWTDSSVLAFLYSVGTSIIDGQLRTINSFNVPIISYRASDDCRFPIRGLVECSAEKDPSIAKRQINRYVQLFGGPIRPVTMFVSGSRSRSTQCDVEVIIDRSATCESQLANHISSGTDMFVEQISTQFRDT